MFRFDFSYGWGFFVVFFFFPTVLFCFDCALQLYVVVFYLIKGVYLTLDMVYKIFVKKSRLAREKDTGSNETEEAKWHGQWQQDTHSEAFIIARGFLHL